MSNTTSRSAIVYTRLSDARNGDSIKDQEERCRKRAADLGWKVVRATTENDLIDQGRSHASAFKRRKVRLSDGRRELRVIRPAWRSVLDDLSSGAADALVALDLDRVARDPRDLEDLIDVVESASPRIPVESVTGSLRLASDADITMARVMVAINNKSSRDTARRVAAARERMATAGAYGGGRRPYGYESDGVTVREREAAEVQRAAEALIAGLSLRQILADFRERGVATVTGVPWTSRTLREILLRPRNVGIAVYKGKEAGPAEWPAILDEGTWRAVRAVLNDPTRRTSPGNQPRWLGSLIYRCCHCGDTVSVSGGRGQNPSYICRSRSHLRRIAGPVDALVAELIIQRLAKPDAADLLVVEEPHQVDAAGMARKVNELRERKNDLGRLYGDGAIDRGQLLAGSASIKVELEKAEAAVAAAAGQNPLAVIAGRADAEAVWAGLDLSKQRAIVQLLLDVSLLPGKGGRLPDGSYFDRRTVRVDWKV